ncbi:hypothetical protein NJB1604_07880 [Mycobacterium marinum]|nr:hypothetical protein NJB1604_07880 [Mycobacterium marinum]
MARIIGPSTMIDTERVLTEIGVRPISYATVKRRMPIWAQRRWRQTLATASVRRGGWGPARSRSRPATTPSLLPTRPPIEPTRSSVHEALRDLAQANSIHRQLMLSLVRKTA